MKKQSVNTRRHIRWVTTETKTVAPSVTRKQVAKAIKVYQRDPRRAWSIPAPWHLAHMITGVKCECYSCSRGFNG